jgi:hypothetical protein
LADTARNRGARGNPNPIFIPVQCREELHAKNLNALPAFEKAPSKKISRCREGRIKKVSHGATAITEEKLRALKFRPFAPSRLRGNL